MLFHFKIARDGEKLGILYNDQIVSGGADKLLAIWDPGTGRRLCTLRGHERPVKALAVLSDSLTLVSTESYTEGLGVTCNLHSKCSIYIWNIDSRELLKKIPYDYEYHEGLKTRSYYHIYHLDALGTLPEKQWIMESLKWFALGDIFQKNFYYYLQISFTRRQLE